MSERASESSKQRALLSVWDKTGLEALAKGLVALRYELVSSGGTSRFLAEHDIPHLEVVVAPYQQV